MTVISVKDRVLLVISGHFHLYVELRDPSFDFLEAHHRVKMKQDILIQTFHVGSFDKTVGQ